MKALIKNALKSGLQVTWRLIRNTRFGLLASDILIEGALGEFVSVEHNGHILRFSAPNRLCRWRAQTFSDKEPETLEWIDAIPEGSTLWDVGANVGIYTIYAVKARRCEVYAFEPSVFNLSILARNIFINGCEQSGARKGKAVIIPVALSDQSAPNNIKLTTSEWGGALSTFGKDYGWDGQPLIENFQYRTVGFRMDDVSSSMAIPMPDFIKVDVDGIEHLVLSGGEQVLSSVKSVLIEVNDAFEEQATQCAVLLGRAGLTFHDKRQSDIVVSKKGSFNNTFNQIWVRR